MNLPVLRSAGPLLARYDVVFCDVWGVVHDGVRAYPEACLALSAFRRQGGTVVLISNAPSTAAEVATLLDRKQVPRDSWDAIVTSGDLTRLRIGETGVKRIYHIGATRGEHVFEGLGVALVDVLEADAIVATELTDYYGETPEDYRDVLQNGASRRLPFICANPDLVVHVGDDLLPCAGALAVLYEQLGGTVYWAGKPHAPIYERALDLAGEVHPGVVDRSRILAIGDALRTDVAGAHAFGIDALFIAGGIHRDELLRDEEIDRELLDHVVASHAAGVVGVMKGLA
jgi:HAD superfamily hydrolase (TIGR01459 family)